MKSWRSESGPAAAPELYLIGCGKNGAAEASPQTLGFKAFNLLRMAQLGLKVPPAFVLGTRYCSDDALRRAARERTTWATGLDALERATGRRLGDASRPLLVSVRSGAPVSMPGMMETLLNVGLCDATVHGFIRQTGNPRLVWDSYHRLVCSFGEVVAGVSPDVFDAERAACFGTRDERDLDFAELRELTQRCLAAIGAATKRPFPQDPYQQLATAIGAVLDSWQSSRAREYRRRHDVDDSLGTAITVQAMVFGNSGAHSGAGVGFTRDPSNGEPVPWVDFLFNAQGEDVVSGRRRAYGHASLAAAMPEVWQSLCDAMETLEHAFGDMQDFEFTIDDGELYLLQTRSAKRSAPAAARIALDMLDAGSIDATEALRRTAQLSPDDLVVERVVSADGEPLAPLSRADSANRGVAVGEIALDASQVQARHAAGSPVVLVRRNAETDDIAALEVAAGLLTARGARTSHAAVVARQLSVVCLVGCEALEIDEVARMIRIDKTTLQEGDTLTLDGNDGTVYAGALRKAIEPLSELQRRFARLREGAPR